MNAQQEEVLRKFVPEIIVLANDDLGKSILKRIVVEGYPIDPALPCAGYGENCLWVITEADRSVTTFLLPQDC